jgi:hypothetical protein
VNTRILPVAALMVKRPEASVLVPDFLLKRTTDTPCTGLPVESVTTPEIFFTWANEAREKQRKVREKHNLRRDFAPVGVVMCSIAIVLE